MSGDCAADALARIAAALERIAPPAPDATDWLGAPAYLWDGAATPVPALEAPPLDLLRGIDAQKVIVSENIARHAAGHAAHDMLLWGARGMGKSALLRAAVIAAQHSHGGSPALVQVAPAAIDRLAALFSVLGTVNRPVIVFIDDLGFEPGDLSGPRALRSWLEGGVAARPANVRLAVTTNRRAIVARDHEPDAVNPRDAADDALALADRFGLSVGFHACSQDDYLAIVGGYCAAHALPLNPQDALEWAKRRGARSGRVAWHYVTELAGRAGRAL